MKSLAKRVSAGRILLALVLVLMAAGSFVALQRSPVPPVDPTLGCAVQGNSDMIIDYVSGYSSPEKAMSAFIKRGYPEGGLSFTRTREGDRINFAIHNKDRKVVAEAVVSLFKDGLVKDEWVVSSWRPCG